MKANITLQTGSGETHRLQIDVPDGATIQEFAAAVKAATDQYVMYEMLQAVIREMEAQQLVGSQEDYAALGPFIDKLKAIQPQGVTGAPVEPGPKSSRRDFVAIEGGRAYRVRQSEAAGNAPWVYYWHEGAKNWVSSYETTEAEANKMYAFALPASEAALYEAGVPFLTD